MKISVGCVADNSQTYLDQALRLLRSWRWFAGAYAQSDFHVCVVEGAPAGFLRQCADLGAQVHRVERFAGRHPTSNKLRFFEVPEAVDADRVLLLDCDTVVVREPQDLMRGDGLTAKIADVATVSLDVFARVFAHLGLSMPPPIHACTVSGAPMIAYFNSGVISMSRRAASLLAPEWSRINGELTGVFEALGGTPHFCEQASLSLALVRTGITYELVSDEMNFPAHFTDQLPGSAMASVDPAIIHYHFMVDDAGFLLPSPYPRVDARIQAFNARLRQSPGS